MSRIDDKITVYASICNFFTEIDPDIHFECLNLQQNTN